MRFCPRCGAPLKDTVSATPPRRGRAALAAVGLPEPPYCKIDCWHGYFKCDFVARAIGTDAEVARSKLFPWRHAGPPPREGKALAAYEELVGRLRELGWKPQGKPRPWYAQRFRRSTELNVRSDDPDAQTEDALSDEAGQAEESS